MTGCKVGMTWQQQLLTVFSVCSMLVIPAVMPHARMVLLSYKRLKKKTQYSKVFIKSSTPSKKVLLHIFRSFCQILDSRFLEVQLDSHCHIIHLHPSVTTALTPFSLLNILPHSVFHLAISITNGSKQGTNDIWSPSRISIVFHVYITAYLIFLKALWFYFQLLPDISLNFNPCWFILVYFV